MKWFKRIKLLLVAFCFICLIFAIRFWQDRNNQSNVLNILSNAIGRKGVPSSGRLSPVKGRPIKIITHGKEARSNPPIKLNILSNAIGRKGVSSSGRLPPVKGRPIKIVTHGKEARSNPPIKLNILSNDVGRKGTFPSGRLPPVKGRPIKIITHGKEARSNPPIKLNILSNDVGRKGTFPSGRLPPVEGRPIKIFTHGKEDWISRVILNPKKHWENQIIQPLLKFLKTHPDFHLIDIGANLGIYTLSVAAMGRRVVAVDANRKNLVRLAKSVEANGLEKNVILVHNALHSRYSTVYLKIKPEHVGASYTMMKSDSTTVAVEAVLADDLLKVINFTKAVFKIDVEGHEGPVLRKASKLFQKVDIPLVLMEWNSMDRYHPKEAVFIRDFFSRRGLLPYATIESTNPLRSNTKWPFDMVWKRSKRLF